MLIEENKSLKNYNTFGIDCVARFFVSVSSKKELINALKSNAHPNIFILGGGSNMLLTKDVEALVIHINFKGINVIFEDEKHIHLSVMGGENWHELVQYCIDKDYGGLENLSLIPGNVGTAPIQNIGAYGVELKDVFENCRAVSINNFSEKEFSKKDCQFGYRNSIFKNDLKGKYIITEIKVKLTKNNHKKNIGYGAIQQELAKKNIVNPSLREISEAIIKIRQSKLPDPNVIGNSGSFFKNPIVNRAIFDNFIKQYPKAPFYVISETEIKIPAGWLIEKAGFKGKRFGDAGVHEKQALVLVNHGNATGNEILELADIIKKSVKEQFGITIVPEVNVI